MTTAGVTAAVVWEFYEWVIEQVNPTGMTVGYTDTVVHLFAGTVGSLAAAAGALVLWWGRRHSPDRHSPDRHRAPA